MTSPTSHPFDRYGNDVLAAPREKPKPRELPLARDLVLEVPGSFTGAVVGWENGLVLLEDRKGKQRAFPVGGTFWVDGKPVAVRIPPRVGTSKPTHTASGSRASVTTAKVALPSRIYVEGRHDAELVEKVWGDDLRHVGVVVEYLGGIDDLPGIIGEFRPESGRRLGVLVDHLVAGSKESRIARECMKSGYGDFLMITGHAYIDIWQAIKPSSLGFKAWPAVPMDEDWKKGTLKRLGQPHAEQADVARAWQAMLARVSSFRDLDSRLNTEVEKLIDFVTADHLGTLDQ
ncbi:MULTISPECIES: DUF3097 family protein [Aestuariimicrobium]|uniref:DUF3097 family protein n=1 Tax=Aestuariimicrobium TaxID=396388 RepID=UPI00042637DE|nr:MULTISPECIES: DUF3097 family protein [Aestuariimicrobium]CAI9411322.1 hypothetical protein AESSP_02625 [Aestuariimicrobium sp. T2.26MG-19.2B]